MTATARQVLPEERDDPLESLLDASEELVRAVIRNGLAVQFEARLRRLMPELFAPPPPPPAAVTTPCPVSITGIEREIRLVGVLSDLGRLKPGTADVSRRFIEADLAAVRAARTTTKGDTTP